MSYKTRASQEDWFENNTFENEIGYMPVDRKSFINSNGREIKIINGKRYRVASPKVRKAIREIVQVVGSIGYYLSAAALGLFIFISFIWLFWAAFS